MFFMELPGVNTDEIDLEISETTVCVRASKPGSEISGCYILAHPVDPDNAYATFYKGVLSAQIPFKVPIQGKKVIVHNGPSDIDVDVEDDLDLR